MTLCSRRAWTTAARFPTCPHPELRRRASLAVSPDTLIPKSRATGGLMVVVTAWPNGRGERHLLLVFAWTWPGLEPTASALQVRCSPVLSYRPKVPPPSLASGYSITPGQASTRPGVRCGPHSSKQTPSPPREKEKGPHRGPADRVERIQSVVYKLRSSEDANNVGASVPPLRAGL